MNAAASQAGLPSLKTLRTALVRFSEKNTAIALRLVMGDYVLFGLGLALVASPTHWVVKVLGSVLIWVQMARLFIIGHDACHHALTPNRELNKWLGRLVFLATLTPLRLWEVGHNMAHHGFTNLRGRDFVWAPFTPQEFARLPLARQWLERYHRSGSGHWLYYLREIWWKKLSFPNKSQGGGRGVFVVAGLVVSAFALLWIGGLVLAARATGQSALLLVALGFLLPFLCCSGPMGFFIYIHHIDPDVSWHDDAAAWADAQPHLTATINVVFPSWIGAALHHIMEHPAHHLDMNIPLYQLKAAQRELQTLALGAVIQRRFTLAWYRRCAATCKLYDFEANKWVQFSAAKAYERS
jgi:acyl-lipid omega-6 desaturase (Delta-12 desaturase)